MNRVGHFINSMRHFTFVHSKKKVNKYYLKEMTTDNIVIVPLLFCSTHLPQYANRFFDTSKRWKPYF